MQGGKKSTWIGGTAFLAVVLLAMTWFLLVAPVRAQAADTREQTATIVTSNAELQRKVDKLKADFAHLDQYKAELKALRTQIPTTAELSDYLVQLNTIAEKNGVVLMDVQPQPAQAITFSQAPAAGSTQAPASTEVQPTASPSPSPSASAGSTAAAPATPKVTTPDGLLGIPVTFKAVGTYQDVLNFVKAAQNTKRLLLVSTLTETSQDESEASGGRPATKIGDAELELGGYLWVLPETTTPAPSADNSDDAAKLPKPGADDNPLVPIDGPKDALATSDK